MLWGQTPSAGGVRSNLRPPDSILPLLVVSGSERKSSCGERRAGWREQGVGRTGVVGLLRGGRPGPTVMLRTDMDAWLKTHVALLMPSLAPALRAAGQDNVRLAHTRDAMLLALRAIREGFRVLKALGYPIVPTNIRIFEWVPEPVLMWLFSKRFTNPHVRVALVEHSEAAQDEIKHLADEFRRLCQQTSIPTPAMDRLYTYFDADTPPLPEGSRTLSMDWRFLWGIAGAAAGILVLGWAFSRLFCRKGKAPCQ
mgnify:CR=1 FL=1